jgi:hypothetical protein
MYVGKVHCIQHLHITHMVSHRFAALHIIEKKGSVIYLVQLTIPLNCVLF